MTAPDQPGLRNPVTKPTSGNDLRDRILAIIRQQRCYNSDTTCDVCEQRADAVMAVVQAELDAKDAEIAQRKSDVDMLSDRVTELEGDSDYWRKRAEAAEERLRDQQTGDQT